MSVLRRREDGAAAVETALCLCFIVLPLVFAMIAYAYMFSFRQALSQATAEGARAAVGSSVGTACTTTATSVSSSTGSFSSSCPAQYFAALSVNKSLSSYGMGCPVSPAPSPSLTNNYLTCTISTPTSCNSGANMCVTVTVAYPYRTQSLMPTIPGFGFSLPPNLQFTSTIEVS